MSNFFVCAKLTIDNYLCSRSTFFYVKTVPRTAAGIFSRRHLTQIGTHIGK